MVKVSGSDALAILRLFGRAGDENVPRHIDRLEVTHPSPTNTLATFRFQRTLYAALFDDTAEDDEDYVVGQVRSANPNLAGQVLPNPRESITMYGMPFKGKDVYLFAAASDKVRLDTELARRYPDASRSTWQKRIKLGHVLVNGEVEVSPKADVKSTDDLAVTDIGEADYSNESLPIIYSDDDVIVVEKPTGMLTHSKGELNEEFTVAEFFRRYTTWGLDGNRPGVIHRLDRATSGVIVGARHEAAAAMLQKQFGQRTVKKHYVAVVDGDVQPVQAKIDLPIARNPSAPSTFRVDVKGKSAETIYAVERSNGIKTLINLYPKTGRTHQLRVHMTYLGHPIAGDDVYGGSLADRLYLHAVSIEVTLPNGQRQTFASPVPPQFEAKVDAA